MAPEFLFGLEAFALSGVSNLTNSVEMDADEAVPITVKDDH